MGPSHSPTPPSKSDPRRPRNTIGLQLWNVLTFVAVETNRRGSGPNPSTPTAPPPLADRLPGSGFFLVTHQHSSCWEEPSDPRQRAPEGCTSGTKGLYKGITPGLFYDLGRYLVAKDKGCRLDGRFTMIFCFGIFFCGGWGTPILPCPPASIPAGIRWAGRNMLCAFDAVGQGGIMSSAGFFKRYSNHFNCTIRIIMNLINCPTEM